ncbi:GNAT family N-acetyltransferase [Priestia endophytica]|uniref:GNAT family N-acetyltransferase n=1 Tax=Priestia endophytica TaxID=135735 RepID=UPI0022808507|nr:GNAT family N-acetyltransferase [Priestia endophytica]MCY8234040.1 GNAT family N-acetyltransferase [Priestia endophytica]
MKLPKETTRLYFQPITTKHRSFLEVLFKRSMLPFVNQNHPIEQCMNHIRNQYITFKIGLWAVHQKTDYKAVGVAGLLLNKINHNTVIELGYAIHPDYQGEGYATEAARSCCFFGFHVHRFPKIYARTHPDNKRSISVLQNLDFQCRQEIRGAEPSLLFESTSIM